MATTTPAPVPLLDAQGKPVIPVTHADAVIDGVNRTNPQFEGDITLNGKKIFEKNPDGSQKPMDPANGGTGFTTLDDLAKKVAELLGFTESGAGESATASNGIIIPIKKGGTGKSTAADALAALGGTSAVLYQVSVPAAWNAGNGGATGAYYKDVTVNGMLSTDVPIVGVVLSDDVSASTNQGKAFANVNRITTSNGSIRLICFTTQPTVAFTIQLLTVRGFKNG